MRKFRDASEAVNERTFVVRPLQVSRAAFARCDRAGRGRPVTIGASRGACATRSRFPLAFLVTFCVLLGAGAVWMGLFVWLLEADSATLNAVAEWVSPEAISGWVFYLLLSIACFIPVARRFLARTREPR